MADPQLVKYIVDNLKKGYDIASIRNFLWKAGYNIANIDAAIREVNSSYNYSSQPQQQGKKPNMIMILAVFVIIAIIAGIAVSYFLLRPGSGSLEPEPECTSDSSCAQGYTCSSGSCVVSENTCSSDDDCQEGYECLNGDCFEKAQPDCYYDSDCDTGYVCSGGSCIVPTEGEPSVQPSEDLASCYDDIQNQNEEGVDCGGVCEACPTCFDGIMNSDEAGIDCGGNCGTACDEPQCSPDCNDGNLCTNDICVDGECYFTSITPCCGNFQCEQDEDHSRCPADCEEPYANKDENLLDPQEAYEKAISLAASDPEAAGNTCQSIKDEATLDTCFIEVAKITQKSVFCDYVSSQARRDSCYILFAQNGDSDLCNKVSSEYLRDGCFMIQDAKKLKDQTANQTVEIESQVEINQTQDTNQTQQT